MDGKDTLFIYVLVRKERVNQEPEPLLRYEADALRLGRPSQ